MWGVPPASDQAYRWSSGAAGSSSSTCSATPMTDAWASASCCGGGANTLAWTGIRSRNLRRYPIHAALRAVPRPVGRCAEPSALIVVLQASAASADNAIAHTSRGFHESESAISSPPRAPTQQAIRPMPAATPAGASSIGVYRRVDRPRSRACSATVRPNRNHQRRFWRWWDIASVLAEMTSLKARAARWLSTCCSNGRSESPLGALPRVTTTSSPSIVENRIQPRAARSRAVAATAV